MIRPLTACMAAPFLGGNLLQGPLRRAVSISIALIALPRVMADSPQGMPNHVIDMVALFTKEAFLGFCWGFAAAKVYYLALSVGAFIDNQRGATIANVLNPMTSDESSVFGELLQQLVLITFFVTGGLHLFLGGLFNTYEVWPVYSYYPVLDSRLPAFFIKELSSLAMLTVAFAAPVIAAMFVVEFGLGLINRFAQQLNVFFLAMPLKSLVALVVLVLYTGTFLSMALKQFSFESELFNVFSRASGL
ncbi:MAG: type III secretion system export apparatus subunit SctT [Planctomycetaceae bacterium]